MSDITNRWDGNYYLTNDQYENTNKYFEDAIKEATIQVSPNTSITYETSANELTCDSNSTTLQINPSTDVSSTTSITKPRIADCGPTCLSNIVGEYIGVIFHDLKIKKIIFNPPATVILWEDGTKTVVKCSEDDEFNPEIGVAMCYMKKIYGSRHAFSKMVEKYEID